MNTDGTEQCKFLEMTRWRQFSYNKENEENKILQLSR